MPFLPAIKPPTSLNGQALWFAFLDGRLLVSDGDPVSVPTGHPASDLPVTLVRRQYLGTLSGTHCFSAEMDETVAGLPDGMSCRSLRELFGVLPDEHYALALRAVQIVRWDQTHQYCGRCGTAMQTRHEERAKVCPACGLLNFPRLSPAVIVAVTRGDRLLLAHAHRHPEGLFSIIAGFVEVGETLEEAVRREVFEETGIRVRNISYFGSQPWPFPDSLMLGFTAEHAGGEIELRDGELAEAAWFRADEFPQIPSKISISRQLIDWFAGKAGC